MTEKYVASGEYWNYFYNVWKTVSSSPFSNAVVFVDDAVSVTAPETFNAEILSIDKSEDGTVITMKPALDTAAINNYSYKFIQTEDMVKQKIAVHPYGAFIFSPNAANCKIACELGGAAYSTAAVFDYAAASVGDMVALVKS